VFVNTLGKENPSVTNDGDTTMFCEINQMLRATAPMLVMAVAWIAVPAAAFARTVYDGERSVLILTRGSACETSLRHGVQIADGMGNNGGGVAAVQGRVTRNEAISFAVRFDDDQWANGSGRLCRNRRGGSRRGEDTRGTYRDTWVAEGRA
jgi:hypothetical protein